MRYLLYIVVVIMVEIFSGCSRHEHFKSSLDIAESLLKNNPDSAYNILREMKIETDKVSQSLRVRYMLLWAQSCNKTYRNLPSEDTLQALVSYYSDNGNERMTALYMMGSLHRDNDDARGALRFFNDAVCTADTLDANCDFYTLSRIYSQMSELFHKQKAPRYELEFGKKAEYAAWKAKDTLGAIKAFVDNHVAYQLMNDTDSVYIICTKAERLYRKMGYNKEAARIMPSLVDIYLSRNNLQQAKKAIDVFERESGYFNANNEIKKGSENYYGLKGRYYFQIERYDSAEYFFRKMLRYHDKIDNFKDGYTGLAALYKRLGLADSVSKYTRLTALISDSIKRKYSPEDFSLSYASYYTGRSGLLVAESEKTSNRYVWSIVIGCIVAILFIYSLFFMYRHKLLDKQKELDAEKRKSKKNEKRYMKVKTEYEQSKKRYDEDIETRSRKISEQEKIIYKIKKEQEQSNINDHEEGMLQLSAHLKMLSKDAQKGMAAEKESLLRLRYMVMMYEPAFWKNISSQQYGFTNRELLICIFIRHEFKPAEIATLLDMSSQVTSNLRSRISKRLFGDASTRRLDDNMLNMKL